MKKLNILVVLLVTVLLFTGCSSTKSPENGAIVIGGKNFTEQDILVYLMKHVIEDQTALKVETKTFLGGTKIVADALDRGDIQIYAEYTGTALINLLKEPLINDPKAAYDKVKSIYRDKKKLEWLEPFGFNNTYTLTMRGDEAKRLGLKTISDLAKIGNTLTLGCVAEFIERPDGLSGLQKKYGFTFKNSKSMDPGLTYAAVRDKKVDVIDGFSTDGRIPAFNLQVLVDDKQFFPPYYAAPVVRADLLKKHPEIGKALNLLAGKLDDKTMASLNAKVDLDKKDPQVVAKEWLQQKGILKK